MRKSLLAALGCAVFASVGCVSSAKYVQKNADGGVIELKAGADPQEAAKLIEKHVGKDYEMTVMPGTAGSVAAGSNFNPNATVQAGQTPTTPTYYQYSRKVPTGTTPKGLPPAPFDGGTIQQTTYQKPSDTQNPGFGRGNAGAPPSLGFATQQ
jgi:hypothetical protein